MLPTWVSQGLCSRIAQGERVGAGGEREREHNETKKRAKYGIRVQKMGALLPLGAMREQFLGAVTQEVARNMATCFSGPAG